MSVTTEVTGDVKAAKKLRLPLWAVGCMFIGAFLSAAFFDRLGKLTLVVPTLNSLLVLGFALVLKRRLWRHLWFWGTMGILAALHIAVILLVPWTTKWVPAPAIAGVDAVDFCLVLWILAVLGRFMEEPKVAER